MINNCKSLRNDCMEIIESICEELGNTKFENWTEKIHHHLEDCPGCESYLKSLEKTLETYKGCREELSAEMTKKVLSSLKKEIDTSNPSQTSL